MPYLSFVYQLYVKYRLVLQLQDDNADSIPCRVTEAGWWKVHEGHRAQVAGAEQKVIEEILAGRNCAATRASELIRGTVDIRISLNDDGPPDN